MRIKYGKKIIWQEKDAWSMDSALNPIIGSGIQFFRDTIIKRKEAGDFIGIPSTLADTYDESASKEENEAAWLKAWDTWISILDDMIYAFLGKEPIVPHNAFEMLSSGSATEGFVECTIIHPDEEAYSRYNLLAVAHEERVSRGLEYFSKYYTSLWW